jgi:hypothetical protein
MVEQSDEIGVMLPVAAHMKLLLDAPEGTQVIIGPLLT